MIDNPQREIGDAIGRLRAIHSIAVHAVDDVNDTHAEGIGHLTDGQIAWCKDAEAFLADLNRRLVDLIQAGHRLP